ncbi:hypothetical protein E4U43_004162 [Claviceps pusilla]|uniref:Uncharacterized protein n=1 Tax=Claviceps pusilla TaxID=123648 RepID=A0A9P7N6G9_9HYPO|nr:hypothetical protein E4U43_004162 [Claviceps pusilla]
MTRPAFKDAFGWIVEVLDGKSRCVEAACVEERMKQRNETRRDDSRRLETTRDDDTTTRRHDGPFLAPWKRASGKPGRLGCALCP